jgi:hypothetical protein
MDSDKNLELVVRQLELHPALKNSFDEILYTDDIKKAVDGTSAFVTVDDINQARFRLDIRTDTYILSLGKRINRASFEYDKGTFRQEVVYGLQKFAAAADFDGWIGSLKRDREIADVISITDNKYSILARLDKIDRLGRVESSRPLLLVPEITDEDLVKVYRWEEANSTRNDLKAPLARGVLEVSHLYGALLSALQKSYKTVHIKQP